MHIPRESGTPVLMKNIKARFRYSPLRSETGMTKWFSSVYVGKTAHVMPVFALAKYRYPASPCTYQRFEYPFPVNRIKTTFHAPPGMKVGFWNDSENLSRDKRKIPGDIALA
jgi:hypothetical protein